MAFSIPYDAVVIARLAHFHRRIAALHAEIAAELDGAALTNETTEAEPAPASAPARPVTALRRRGPRPVNQAKLAEVEAQLKISDTDRQRPPGSMQKSMCVRCARWQIKL